MNLHSNLIRAGAVALMLALPGSAFATSITGSSSGTFSGVNCTASCGTSSGNTELDFGTYYFFFIPFGTSTITAVPLSFNVNTTATGVQLAELTWDNQTTDTANSSHNPDVTAKWNFGIHFTSPSNVTDSGAYNLAIDQTNNPNIADTVTFSVATPLVLTFGNVTVSNLRFVEVGDGSFANNVWTDPEGGTSHLFLEADFTNTQAGQQSSPVPEPGSMMLLGTGLLGLASGVRRRLKK
jgi:hypothetical protein